jgi:hypothetical protein
MYSEMFHKLEHFPILRRFPAFMPHADSAPGIYSERKDALSLGYAGQSRG